MKNLNLKKNQIILPLSRFPHSNKCPRHALRHAMTVPHRSECSDSCEFPCALQNGPENIQPT